MGSKIKICGITNLDDALAALEAGADYLGLIFAQSSPRRVELETAKEIIAGVAGRAQIVGVFKDQDIDFVSELAVSLKLDYVQCHGKENLEYIRRLPTKVIKVLELEGVNEAESSVMRAAFATNSPSSPEMGASANSVANADVRSDAETAAVGPNWQAESAAGIASACTIGALAQEWKDDVHFLLFDRPKLLSDPDWYKRAFRELLAAQPLALPYFFAGGLSAENVGEVVEALQPFAVDVASSVESSPGKKDVSKMSDFCKAVKRDSGGVSACAH